MATEIFQLLGKIGLDGVEETHKQIDGVNNKAGTLGKAFNKAGQIALGVGKAVAVGVGAASVAIGGIVKSSVDAYAEYEQLMGGAKLMFGEAYDFIADKAAGAYALVQMSQSEYLQQVNGFAVGLKTALGGDAQAAAELADKIITAEADIVAATGQTAEAVQNAFNGIMKGNFTMLDNLQIGITPTKEGFKDLIKTVNAWNKANGNATNYTINNIADCQAALVDYIKMQGMAGYASAEAMETIQGSAAATKSAWKNLIIGFADEEQDLEELVDNFVSTAVVMIGNIGERVQEILPRLVEGLGTLIEALKPHLKMLIETMLPGIIEGAVTLFVGLIEALPGILQILIEQIPFILTTIGTALVEAFPVLLETIKSLVGDIWDYIVVDLLGFEQTFDDTWAEITRIFDEVWAELEEIWVGIGQPIWNAIQDVVTSVRDTFEEYMPEIEEFVDYAFEQISTFWEEDLQPCLEAIATFVEETLAPIFEEVFAEIIMPVVLECFAAITDAWENSLKPMLEGITAFLTGTFSGDWETAWEGIKEAAVGALELLNLAAEGPLGILKKLMDETVEYILSKFDFEWKLPEIKLPHFSIDGEFSLKPLSVPSINVSWYKKAMNDPMILDEPTIFGYSAASGNLLGGGEAGSEVVSGAGTLMGMIQSAVAEQNNGIVPYLQAQTELLQTLIEMFPETMIDAFKSMKFDVNNREFARLVKAVN